MSRKRKQRRDEVKAMVKAMSADDLPPMSLSPMGVRELARRAAIIGQRLDTVPGYRWMKK